MNSTFNGFDGCPKRAVVARKRPKTRFECFKDVIRRGGMYSRWYDWVNAWLIGI